MNTPKEITGEWIREQCEFAYETYANTDIKNGQFTLSNSINELKATIKKYQNICPHKYNDLGICIFCRKVKEVPNE